MLEEIKNNIQARFKAKRYCIWKEKIVEKGNDGYFIYNGKIYYGNRLLVFFYSNQNAWYEKTNTTPCQ